MAASGRPGLIVATGSKQGITTPPGDPAYNVAKAGVKAFTEALQHALRNTEGCQTEARLFIPGWVHTPLTARGRDAEAGRRLDPGRNRGFPVRGAGPGEASTSCAPTTTSTALPT